ncbi:unnamed protein product, partial [Merluccius merluccius]
MSTTRPLLAMNRASEPLSRRQQQQRDPPSSSASTTNNTVNTTSTNTVTVDEFAVLEDKQEELRCAKPRVEQVFRVAFTIIGLLDHSGGGGGGGHTSRQIWLQLKGNRDDVSKAKEYVRGLCDPELQEVERYPVDMHCIFAGARGLFLDRLLRDTSAEVLVPEPGRLRLLGRVEPVVMAQSRVQQFVALFQEKRSLPGDREPGVKRAFKSFVEERDDKYTMELLLLPSALKEELLGLAQSPSSTHPGSSLVADAEQDRSQSSTPVTELSNRILDTSFEEKGGRAGPASGDVGGKAGGGISLGPDALHLNGVRPSHKRRSSESETRDTKRQFSLERHEESPEQERERERERRDRDRERERERERLERDTERERERRESRLTSSCRSRTPSTSFSRCSSSSSKANTIAGPIILDSSEGVLDDGEAVSPETNLRCLVNFFRTMGYQQEVVERIVKETGQIKDTFLVLERIVEETKRYEQEGKGGELGGRANPSASSSSSSVAPSSVASSTVSHAKVKECGKLLVDVTGKPTANIKPAHSNGLGHRRHCSSGGETKTQQATTIKRSSTAQGGAGSCEVITIDDDDDDPNDPVATDTTKPGRGASRLTAMEHLDSGSGSRTDYLARGAGGSTARDYLARAGTQTLGGQVKVETVTALRSVPQWRTATTTTTTTPSSSTNRGSAPCGQRPSHNASDGSGPLPPVAADAVHPDTAQRAGADRAPAHHHRRQQRGHGVSRTHAHTHTHVLHAHSHKQVGYHRFRYMYGLLRLQRVASVYLCGGPLHDTRRPPGEAWSTPGAVPAQVSSRMSESIRLHPGPTDLLRLAMAPAGLQQTPALQQQTPAPLASLGTPGVAPTAWLAFPLQLPVAVPDPASASAALEGGDTGAEGEAVRHLPRAEATHRQDPQRQPLHEGPERPVRPAPGI